MSKQRNSTSTRSPPLTPAARRQFVQRVADGLALLCQAAHHRPELFQGDGHHVQRVQHHGLPGDFKTGFMRVPATRPPAGRAERSTSGTTTRRR